MRQKKVRVGGGRVRKGGRCGKTFEVGVDLDQASVLSLIGSPGGAICSVACKAANALMGQTRIIVGKREQLTAEWEGAGDGCRNYDLPLSGPDFPQWAACFRAKRLTFFDHERRRKGTRPRGETSSHTTFDSATSSLPVF